MVVLVKPLRQKLRRELVFKANNSMVNDYITQLVFRSEVAPLTYHFRFKLDGSSPFVFIPGQYLLLKIGEFFRQFSICSYQMEDNTFDLVADYFKGGLASEYLLSLKEGDKVFFKGPAGVFIQQPVVRPVVYLATGTGVAPILAMIDSVVKKEDLTHPFYLFWGVETENDAYFIPQLTLLKQKQSLFTFALCLSQQEELIAPPFYKGHIQDNIFALLGESLPLSNCDVYVCGGKEAVESLKEFSLTNGVPKEHLYFERFN